MIFTKIIRGFISAERISDYMTEAVNTDSIAVAEMFHNAAWGVRTLWFEL
ncbi:hypothetical protein, partial [Escherichia coli]